MVLTLKENRMTNRLLLFIALRMLGIPRWLRRLLMPAAGLYLLATERAALLQLLN